MRERGGESLEFPFQSTPLRNGGANPGYIKYLKLFKIRL